MFETYGRQALARRRRTRACVARERSASYAAATPERAADVGADADDDVPGHRGSGTEATAPQSLAGALAALEAAIDGLASVDLGRESDRGILNASVRLQRLEDRCIAQQLRVLDAVDRRDAYGLDGAVTAASWLRARTGADHGTTKKRVLAAVRLRRLPQLRGALEAGEVTFGHVAAVTEAAVPTRMDAVAAAEDTLVRLAKAARPWDVRRAMRHLADQVDADGADAPPLGGDGPDERRQLRLAPTIDGLWALDGLLDPITGEMLATALDAADVPDPADPPADRRRTPGQRRHDALHEVLRRILDAGELPTVQGVKPHLLAMADMATMAGADAAAERAPRLRYLGEISPALARRIAREAKITAVQTMGPWRVVNVGRTFRTLPSWLRGMLEMIHRHCRGPDCDRPAAWAEAHHQHAWSDGGDTDLNATIPVCKAHHDLVTSGRWSVTFDPDTGVCTWTGPEGQTIQTRPPAP